MPPRIWRTSRREIGLERPLVMGILNVTPDSFSDGGKFLAPDAALLRVEEMLEDGADVLDVGGESTRPGSARITPEEEIDRVVPVIEQVARRFDVPISIDTSRAAVANAAIQAGAEIVNDISGLRWDEEIAAVAAQARAAVVLMHSRGEFETMHSQEPVADIVGEVQRGLKRAVATALSHDVDEQNICLDIGIGFGKTVQQNLELLAKLDTIVAEFENFPLLVGTSRKSFIGKILGGAPPGDRIGGSLATAMIAAQMGAKILRVHDVRETVAALKLLGAVESEK